MSLMIRTRTAPPSGAVIPIGRDGGNRRARARHHLLPQLRRAHQRPRSILPLLRRPADEFRVAPPSPGGWTAGGPAQPPAHVEPPRPQVPPPPADHPPPASEAARAGDPTAEAPREAQDAPPAASSAAAGLWRTAEEEPRAPFAARAGRVDAQAGELTGLLRERVALPGVSAAGVAAGSRPASCSSPGL